MAEMKASEARENFADTLNRVAYGGERIVLNRRGRPVAALVAVEDLEALEAAEDAEDVRVARERLRDGEETMTLEEVKAGLGL